MKTSTATVELVSVSSPPSLPGPVVGGLVKEGVGGLVVGRGAGEPGAWAGLGAPGKDFPLQPFSCLSLKVVTLPQ